MTWQNPPKPPPDADAEQIARELDAIDRLAAETGRSREAVAQELIPTFPHSPLRRYAYARHFQTAGPLPVDAEQARADAVVYEQFQRLRSENPFHAEQFRRANADAIRRK